MFRESITSRIPDALKELVEVSFDLRWTGSQFIHRLWDRFDSEAWEATKNAAAILLNMPGDRLEAAANDEKLGAELANWLERRRNYLTRPGWFASNHDEATLKGVAYFSMEFGLTEALPIYSGGLGILAGDHLKSASDLAVPLFGIGLFYQQGYFRQVLAEDGGQLEAFPYNDPSSMPVQPLLGKDGQWLRLHVRLPGRTLLLRVWQVKVGRVTLFLLDSNDPMNTPWDRGITTNLYGAGTENRLLQEIVLGFGGWQLLERMGVEIDVCHLNEGHAAFAILARAASFARKHQTSFENALWATRAGNVFTTHTPVPAAFDKFDATQIQQYASAFCEEFGILMDDLLALGRHDRSNPHEPFNIALLALRGSCHINGVSKLHGQVSRRIFNGLFPRWSEKEIPIGHVTNGVHVPSWDSPHANRLWSKAYRPHAWIEELEEASNAIDSTSDEELWEFRAQARQSLVDYVRRRITRQVQHRAASPARIRQVGHILDPNALTLGFARRFAPYKRPTLLLHDFRRFERLISDPERPVQLIVAGKAHPQDERGKAMVKQMAQFSRNAPLSMRVVFLEDYEISLAQELAAGIDVWINTPRRPKEACGTSGMKMLVNGGLNLSTLDGWWDEAYDDSVGWAIGNGVEGDGVAHDAMEASHLYEILEQQVVPEFYDRDADGIPRHWVRRVRASMSKLTSQFSSTRMMREYVEQKYLPAAKAYHRRAADGARVARELAQWSALLEEDWASIRFGQLDAFEHEGAWRFQLQVYFGDVSHDHVRVELFTDCTDGGSPLLVPMKRRGPMVGTVNCDLFEADVPADRPREHYTPRVVPHHPDAFVPIEANQILWAQGDSHAVIGPDPLLEVQTQPV
jgi:starch phosphorylase